MTSRIEIQVVVVTDTKGSMESAIFHTKLCSDEVVNPASLGFIGSGSIAQALLTTFLKEGVCVCCVCVCVCVSPPAGGGPSI